MVSLGQGFLKGDSGNLPMVDVIMVMEYFNQNKDYINAELRGVKMEKSAKTTYGDNAIGYIQVNQDQSHCFIKARITPEYKIKSKNYNVSCKIHTIKNSVEEVLCHDCPASKGGCKHAVAFLMWLHRRTKDPSTTEKACYWRSLTWLQHLQRENSSKFRTLVKDLFQKIGTNHSSMTIS